MKKCLLISIILLLISVSILAEGARPFNGAYVKDFIKPGDGVLNIINNNTQMDTVAVLVPNSTDKIHILAIYIRSNESYSYSGIADGSYKLYYEKGTNWDSGSRKFTNKGGFWFGGSLLFNTKQQPGQKIYKIYSIWTVILRPTANTTINENDFPVLT